MRFLTIDTIWQSFMSRSLDLHSIVQIVSTEVPFTWSTETVEMLVLYLIQYGFLSPLDSVLQHPFQNERSNDVSQFHSQKPSSLHKALSNTLEHLHGEPIPYPNGTFACIEYDNHQCKGYVKTREFGRRVRVEVVRARIHNPTNNTGA